MNVSFTLQAVSDLLAIQDYIATQNERAAERVVSRIRQAIQMFERFPFLGREGLVDGTREFAIPGLSYVVVYRIASETDIDILTIIHDRQQWPPL
ncbi:MAG: type II toxin-antitoxin system RelE/ParE family toxin [Sphingomonadales bacterium]